MNTYKQELAITIIAVLAIAFIVTFAIIQSFH
jgi:hypothetical protein